MLFKSTISLNHREKKIMGTENVVGDNKSNVIFFAGLLSVDEYIKKVSSIENS